jgi:type VI secretion system protein ImpL
MLKYIVAAFVVIAVWVAWFAFLMDVEMAILIPIAVTVLVVLVLAAIVVARRLRARRAARELEKALAAQAAEQARSARPDMQAEVLQMQQEFQRAIAALKSARVQGGESALYALPWHVLIGPPGSGKSTALRNSGLQFPYMSTSGGGVRGVGGTRNCDWWLTNDGVLLDTAGRWTTEEEDRDEWLGFLDLIKKFRPKKPLNGIVATISLDQLGGAHEEEVSALARRMRERIDEVQNRLQMSLPVYVLFTKADLIPGFVETFNDLSKQERGQMWGFTVPVTAPPGDPGMHFSERFDELTGIVEKRSLRRMGEERKIESRELIHSFPQQLVTLKKNCQDFVGKLYETSHFGQTPMFRGVYFSSGTQEGRPIDRVMHKMAEAFGIRSEVHLGEPVTEAKSYFLRDVFLQVVFPDGDLAMRSRAEIARQRRNQFLAAGIIAFTAFLIATLPVYAFMRNGEYIDETSEIVDNVSAAAERDGPLEPGDLRPLQRRVAEMERWERRTPPVYMRMGMYQDEVFNPLQRYYQGLFRAEVVRPIFQADYAELDEFGRRYAAINTPPSGPEHTENYDRLRAHLLLTRPRAEGEPELSDSDNEAVRQWLGRRIARQWIERIDGGDVEDDVREEVRRQSDQYVTLLALEEEEEELAPEDSIRFPRDDEAVERARQALTRVSLTDMALERLISEVGELGYDLRLVDLIGNTVNPMRSFDAGIGGERTVRGAFTARGWDNRVRDMLYEGEEGSVFGEAWVLGNEAARAAEDREAHEEQLCQLRDQYFRAYVQEWLTFLRAINVTMRRDNDVVLADLQDLTRGDPEPYRLLFQQTLHNTILEVPGEEDDEAAQAAGASAWERFWNWVGRNRYGRVANEIRRDMESGDIPIEPDDDCDHLDPRHVFVAFEGFTRVGATPPPPPPEEGQEPPPAPPVPVDSYEEQLHAVRDALQAHLQTPEGTGEGLDTALATARTSTYALIESQELGWRPLLQQLMLPPIEGSVISVATGQAGAAGRSWCTEVYSPYHRNILGGYPLNHGGHDVPLADFAEFYAPEGTLWAFYNEVLDRHTPREGDTFAFSTRLGRAASSAYRTELLQYLERANDITATMFPPGSEEPLVEFDVRVQPSVRVATQELCVSGTCYEHHNGPERWIRMAWPGEDPVAGASIEVRGEDGIHERIVQEGEWGLFRLFEQGTVTSTSRGRRVFTMTWRLRDHDVDVAIDIRPVRGDAPFFGVAGRERNPAFLQPLRGRHVDPPQQIASSRNTCRVVGATVQPQQ